jgi:thiamine kinase-like enzyme
MVPTPGRDSARAKHRRRPAAGRVAGAAWTPATEKELRALPWWGGEIELEALPGGLTNRNYRVVAGDRVFAVRTGCDDPVLGICRRNELLCIRVAVAIGLAPAVVQSAPGVLVTEFIAGTPLSPELVATRLDRIAAALRAIHGAGAAVTGHLLWFSPFQVARTYVRTAVERGLLLPAAVAPAALLAEVAELESQLRPFTPTFCHNDLMPANILDAGDRLWVIDWEYAGVGHPLFDVAGLASNCAFDDAADRRLLTAYCGRFDPQQYAQFRVLKAMAALRESLWAVLQGAQTTIEFDYAGYRDDNYRKYRATRSADG